MSEVGLNNSELMDTIRCYPAIYDKGSVDFRDKNKKANAWKAVSEKCSCEVASAQTRYRTIRTKLGKYLAKLKLPSGSGHQGGVLKPEFESLRWLVSHIKSK